MCHSRIHPYLPHGWPMEFPRGWGAKKWKFSNGWGCPCRIIFPEGPAKLAIIEHVFICISCCYGEKYGGTTSTVEKNREEYKLQFSRNTSSTLIMKIEAWWTARNHIDYKTELSPNQPLCLKWVLKFILHVKFWSRLFCHMLGNKILNGLSFTDKTNNAKGYNMQSIGAFF